MNYESFREFTSTNASVSLNKVALHDPAKKYMKNLKINLKNTQASLRSACSLYNVEFRLRRPHSAYGLTLTRDGRPKGVLY